MVLLCFFFLSFYFLECSGSLSLLTGFLESPRAGATPLIKHGLLTAVLLLLQRKGLVALWCVGSPQTRGWTVSPTLTGRFLTAEPPGKPQFYTAFSNTMQTCLTLKQGRCNLDGLWGFSTNSVVSFKQYDAYSSML